ncbi:glycoside hydrolase family 99-like domain-containing protein [Jannaschia pohangensis]|uniref:Rhamnan synthesis protein F n=1 Tax=Jannaschia pohangensis TaxID=390807 RepID=A0A1I3RF96_9RHOB|nr:glycoside hydrolase family 99-like domain-containing protein [Jannaschia pohangensis]SFJ43967.1 Rhamnan synthesis protein F [Jannaschia pohangensis]
MDFTIRSKVSRLMSFLLPNWQRDRYAYDVWRSGLFDRAFYAQAIAGANPIYRAFPIRHFTRFGEAFGLQPNSDFSPHAYLRLNPDLQTAPMAPFQHFVSFGRKENRPFRDTPCGPSPRDIALADRRSLAASHRKARSRFALHLHLYYLDLWEEFEAAFRSLDIAFDLFVTITYFGPESEALRDRIVAADPNATVLLMPNRGRDIFPFVHLVNADIFAGYEAVAKIHSKRSPHREDGDAWRDQLVGGLLSGQATGDLLEGFLADADASLWVSDGQHYADPIWWGSNRAATERMLTRVEIPMDAERLSFPAGSMYWLKPELVATIRGLGLSETDFEREAGQVDGTTAHAFERALGYMAEDGGRRIVQTSHLANRVTGKPLARPSFVSAFYLPQFHRVPQNDAWWGEGYTEWSAAASAQPNFAGHQQPQLPTSLGFYDLRQTEVMGEQAALARSAGIDAFCTYFYWFDEKRILESPIDRLLARPDIDFPFYLCWANEAWRRNWDGLSGEVLLDQTYAPGFEAKLARDTARYMRDPRYQRPDGVRPRFVIYRAEDMPDPVANVARLRQAWRSEQLGEVELGAVLFHVAGDSPVPEGLFDFQVEMPPHGLVGEADYLVGGPKGPARDMGLAPGFDGLIYDYRAVARNAVSDAYRDRLPADTIAGIMPSWDNTARRGGKAHVAWGANPMTFDRWMQSICERRLASSYGQELFINAWNEWAEKAMLEPTRQYGDANLRVLRKWASGPKARRRNPVLTGHRVQQTA